MWCVVLMLFEIKCHCEGAREKLRKNHGKLTSLTTAQKHVTFGFASKSWPKNWQKIL